MRSALFPARPRAIAMVVVVSLLAALLSVFAVAQPTAAATEDPLISLDAKVTASVLSGAEATVTLTATNRSAAGTGTSLYNLGYSYILPPGVSIKGAATSDGHAVGAPTSTTLTDGSTLLVFPNVSDLVAGDQKSIAFQVSANTGTYLVGSSFGGSARVAANTSARTIPTFSTSTDPATAGSPVAATTTNSAADTANTTSVSAIKVTKAERSPENELVRGVHDQPTVYTLVVTNTSVAPTDGVTVTDYLPAGLEFLGCGAIDNTTTGPEYDGAATLDRTSVAGLTDCTTPVSVTTVNDVPEQGSKVFTKVVWNLGQVTGSAPVTIRYVAAVPLRENTMTFRTGTDAATAATPSALASAANLDNNTGASTRQNGTSTVSNGQGQTNLVTASGTYSGAVAPGASQTQSDSAELTVEAMDLAVAKTVDTDPVASGDQSLFVTGKHATYSLLVRTSEYESSDDITLTDTLPNGLCPVFPASVTRQGSFPAECDPSSSGGMNGQVTAKATDGSSVTVTVERVVYDAATGTFAMTFSLPPMTTNRSVTVQYEALMRTTYSSSAQAGPTAAGDAFRNTVQMRGTSTGVHGDTGTQTVSDDSAATIVSSTPSIEKQVLPRSAASTISGVADCAAAGTSKYTTASTEPFSRGDQVCFRLQVTFPAGVETRNATVTDMLPVGTTSANGWTKGDDWVVGEESDVADVALSGTPDDRSATFAVGRTVTGASGTYVDSTSTDPTRLVLYVMAHIDESGADSAKPDITANLMKYAQQNTDGKVTSLRDAVDYSVAGSPVVTLDKHITRVGTAASRDPQYTTEGQTLEYTLTVTNTKDTGAGLPINAVTVWDALPAGISCDAVAESAAFDCLSDPPTGAATRYADRDFLVWKGLGPIAPGASIDLTYTMTVPNPGYAGTAYTNAASVVSFATASNDGTSQTWIPAPSGTSAHSAAATGDQGAAVSADAQRTVTIQPNTVQKSGGAVPGGTNRSGTTAVPGQGLQYTYTATVPAHTSVGSAVLADTLPSGIGTTSSTTWSLTMPGSTTPVTRSVTDGNASVEYGTAADGNPYTFTFTGGASQTSAKDGGALRFPTTFDNTGDTDLVFSVTVSGLRVTSGLSATNTSAATYADTTLTNTASFTSTDPVTKAPSAPTSSVSVVSQAPKMTVAKTHTPTGPVTGADTITWKLVATNSASATDARSVIVADCFPDSLTFGASTPTEASSTDVTTAQRAALACATGTTLHAWNVGTIAAGASKTITVTGTLGSSASATSSFKNTAVVLASSLDSDYGTTGTAYVQRVTKDDSVSVASPTVTKTLTAPNWNAASGTVTSATTAPTGTTPLSVRAGDTGTYTVTVTVPQNVALHDGVVTDTLPAGVVRNGAPAATVSPNSITAVPVFDSGDRVLTVRLSDIGTDQAQAVKVTITVPVRIGSGATSGTATSNTANLTWNRTQGDTSTTSTVKSNAALATVVTPSLTVRKSATTGGVTSDKVSAEPGASVGYTVTVTNAAGASPASATRILDCVPAGIVVDTTKPISNGGVFDPAGAGCGGGTITWTGLTVPGGSAAQSVLLTYSARLAPDTDLDGTALVNKATVSSYRSLPDTQDGAAGDSYGPVSATAQVTPAFPKVAVAKSNDTVGGLSYVGVPSDFSVTFTNTGSAATNVAAKDVLPANWQYVAGSATLVRDGGAATPVADPTTAGSTLTWSSLGQLGANATMTLHYRATPTADAATTPGAGTTVAHTNHVTATVTDASGGTAYDGGDGSFVAYPDGGDDATATARIAAADLALTKTATTAKVVAGATTTKAWTITVTNAGDDAAHGTTVVDAPTGLPTGATLAFSGTGWTCTPTDGTWSCVNGATVAKGASFPELDVALTLPANAPLTAIRNTATIHQGTGQTFDPKAGNDSDTASVTPVAIADLAITKTGPSEKAQAGRTISWNLSVQNLQDTAVQSVSDARGTVTVTDTLPDTVTLVSATSTDAAWTCDTDDDTVTCTRDGLANGTTAGAITVTATVHSDVTAAQSIVNTAAVAVDSTKTTDPTTSNDDSKATTAVDDTTSLTIDKAFGSDALVAGDPADWTVTVTNTGTADARTVRVTDTLESGTRLRSDAPVDAATDTITQTDGPWTCTAPAADGTDVTCALDGALAAGKSTTFTITVTTPSSFTGTLVNTAVVTADNAATAQDQARSDASQTAGLSVTKTADVETVDAGKDVTYTITVANPKGPSDLPAGDDRTPSVRVQDTLPAGVEFRGLSPETEQHWALESNEDGVLTLSSTDGIAAGASDPNTIVLTVHVPASFRGSSIVNTATASPVTASGPVVHDEATVDVTTHADLSITKQRTSAPSADAGTDVTYDVTVTNDGPSDAQDVSWSDTPPTGMTIRKVTTDAAWEQGADAGTWTTDTLASGDTAVFHVTASIASGTPAGTLRNTATVSSATPDTDPTNDTAGDDVAVTTHATLGLVKTPVAKVGSTTASKRVTAGAEQVWLLQVHNEGPSDEQPTTVVTDVLPEGLTFAGASSDGAVWTCDGTTDPKLVTCSLPTTIVAGTDAPGLWITTKVASGYTAGQIANRAVISGQGTPAPAGTNDQPVTSPLDVDEVANVAITIGHDGTAVIGKDLPETIQVRNAGLSDAVAVTATYTLPKGLTYVSTEADAAWTVTGVVHNADGSTTVSFALAGTLPTGSLAPVITVHQTPTAAAYPGVQPSATVATTTTETTLADNEAADELAVDPASSLSVTKTHTGQVVRGQTVGYTITVRNDGPTEDPGPVVVTDRLPVGLTLVSVNDAKAATCTTGQTVTCTLTGPLAVDGQVAFQVTAKVATDAPDRITNVATVESPTTQVVPIAGSASPTDPMRASDPAPVRDAPKPAGELAFTGAAGLGIGALIALLAMTAGGVLLVTRRRRRA